MARFVFLREIVFFFVKIGSIIIIYVHKHEIFFSCIDTAIGISLTNYNGGWIDISFFSQKGKIEQNCVKWTEANSHIILLRITKHGSNWYNFWLHWTTFKEIQSWKNLAFWKMMSVRAKIKWNFLEVSEAYIKFLRCLISTLHNYLCRLITIRLPYALNFQQISRIEIWIKNKFFTIEICQFLYFIRVHANNLMQSMFFIHFLIRSGRI
jgi:hypothetical protein